MYGAFSQVPEAELFLLSVRPLQYAGIRYIVTGSVAAIFYGEPRLTFDVDLVVFLNDKDIKMLAEIFRSSDFYLPPSDIIAAEARREMRGHFNIVHLGTGFKADIYLTGRDELEAWAFRHQRVIQFEGESVALAPPEYVIVRKLEYYREGGSEKHLRDLRSIWPCLANNWTNPVCRTGFSDAGCKSSGSWYPGEWHLAAASSNHAAKTALPSCAHSPNIRRMLARVLSAAVYGVDAFPVEVEVNSGWGDTVVVIVGLPDAAVKESRDRVSTALTNSGFKIPMGRTTINLAPADVKKEGPSFDLPIAIGMLAANDQLMASQLDNFMMVGELALTGQVGPVGLLPPHHSSHPLNEFPPF
jgi:hypothetical protein